MLSKHRLGSFLLIAMLLLGGLVLGVSPAQAHDAIPVASTINPADCAEDMTDVTQHCCVSTACISIAIFVPRVHQFTFSRAQIHSQTDRYKRAHMFMPGVDIPPPRLVS